jgi:hypothetical protein
MFILSNGISLGIIVFLEELLYYEFSSVLIYWIQK